MGSISQTLQLLLLQIEKTIKTVFFGICMCKNCSYRTLMKLTPGQDRDGCDVIIFSFSSSLLFLRVDDVLHQLDLLLLPALRGRQQHLDGKVRFGLTCVPGISKQGVSCVSGIETSFTWFGCLILGSGQFFVYYPAASKI